MVRGYLRPWELAIAFELVALRCIESLLRFDVLPRISWHLEGKFGLLLAPDSPLFGVHEPGLIGHPPIQETARSIAGSG